MLFDVVDRQTYVEGRQGVMARGLTLDAAVLLRDSLFTDGDPRLVESKPRLTYGDSIPGRYDVMSWQDDQRIAANLTLDDAILKRYQRLVGRPSDTVVIVPATAHDAHLTQTDARLVEAIKSRLPLLHVSTMHTGGGCMVCRVVLDGDDPGREIWLTREGDGSDPADARSKGWYFGFYNFGWDEADEGIALDTWIAEGDNPAHVADAVVNHYRRITWKVI